MFTECFDVLFQLEKKKSSHHARDFSRVIYYNGELIELIIFISHCFASSVRVLCESCMFGETFHRTFYYSTIRRE